MSNNIYDILKKIENLETPRQTLTEGKKAKPDYIDIDKDGNPMMINYNHHCSTCGRCVFMKEHHCFFTSNCIGIRTI